LNMFTIELEVVNDIAKSGVRLMEEFKNNLIDDEEQRKMLLQLCRRYTKALSRFAITKGPLRDRKQRNLNFGQHLSHKMKYQYVQYLS